MLTLAEILSEGVKYNEVGRCVWFEVRKQEPRILRVDGIREQA